MSLEQDINSITESLRTVGGELRAYSKETKETTAELKARMQALEQHVVKFEGHSFGGASAGPTIGARALSNITDNSAFANLKDWNVGTCRIKLDASIRAALTNDGMGTSNDGTIPNQPERRGLVTPVQRPLRLLDVLPSRPIAADSSEYVQLNATGDAAEQDHEGDEKAEIDIDGSLVRADIATIAAHTTASRQVLSDHAALQAAIDTMIRNKLLTRLENQIINGTGAQGKIKGLLTLATTFIPTIGTTPADIIGESLTRQANYGYLPNLIIMNPMDWFRIQITKTATEEEYLFGSPTMPVPPALWNAAIVATPSVAEGTALTVDTAFTTVLDRENPSVMLSNSHKDYFTRNLVAILGELRAGLEVLDTGAIYKMDLTPLS
ncbi:phage major capsid protein [Bordetella bronchialis]|uniref:phage major capsid protein n=1 Tax=Bordetella bronchialis TaxID=463025 RepID=UPI003CFE6F11